MESSTHNGERRLVPRWSPELIVLSYCISWLGAYTSTQIVIHAKYTRRPVIKWLWTFLASVAFGFSAIWAMHFVGMLACRLDVKVDFDIPLTIFSAFVAVAFTFAAFSSAYISESIENSKPVLALARWGKSIKFTIVSALCAKRDHDIEAAGYLPVSGIPDDGDVPQAEGAQDEAAEDEVGGEDNLRRGRSSTASLLAQAENDSRIDMPAKTTPKRDPLKRTESSSSHGLHTSISFPSSSNSQAQTAQSSGQICARTQRSSSTTPSDSLSTDDSGSQESLSRSRSNSAGSHSLSLTNTTTSTNSWNEPLHTGLSREARLRIKASARDRPVPTFGWRYWLKAHYKTITPLVLIRASIWALAIVFMHYSGMWAMIIPEGRVSWNWGIVTLSYLVAFTVCFVACVTMVHMEVHFGRQVAFSTIASAGCCSMHYTGMAAATFHSRAAPNPNPGYPTYLPFAIIGIALFVCVISNVVLAHSAISSRNRMAEMILTKRRLWRIMAEKDAAEQANELKQQFISVASHEIRTPLHAVNGYCELLALTELSEEQSVYITSIQQACHAINVIAGNVLDFSKLDRDNVELSARPVPVDLRKMVENMARITETRGTQSDEAGVDVIVSVTDDVPASVQLDETYTFRILMNLLSNAQKFCDNGYIGVAVSMGALDQVVIKVSDSGCGIPRSFRSALFQPFRQADTSLTRPRQGTGLGLSIVKHLLQRMNGSVDVESTEGEGTTFTVKLPTSPPTPSHSPPSNTRKLSTAKKVKVIYGHIRTAGFYVDLFNTCGFTATFGNANLPLSELARDTDFIWTDVTSLKSSPSLRNLIKSDSSRSFPPLFIVHSDAAELATLSTSVSSTHGVILVKRPIVFHSLLDLFEAPVLHLGKQVKSSQPKVRFELPEENSSKGEETDKEKAILLPPIPASTPPIVERTPPEPVPKGRVLLVEDNMVSQGIGCRFLARFGYKVVTAKDGQEAVDKAKDGPYVCCLMDCQMPVLDGFAATRKIRELENNGTITGRLPIIALTANVNRENEEKCKAAGMDSFLAKPLKLQDLKTAMDQVTSPQS